MRSYDGETFALIEYGSFYLWAGIAVRLSLLSRSFKYMVTPLHRRRPATLTEPQDAFTSGSVGNHFGHIFCLQAAQTYTALLTILTLLTPLDLREESLHHTSQAAGIPSCHPPFKIRSLYSRPRLASTLNQTQRAAHPRSSNRSQPHRLEVRHIRVRRLLPAMGQWSRVLRHRRGGRIFRSGIQSWRSRLGVQHKLSR